MSDLAIRAECLSKRYQKGYGPLGTLRDVVMDWVRHPLRRLKKRTSRPNDFWALQEASFEIKQGEVIGVIGKNGAGKSTLLKILSRVTEPTHGRAAVRGRVGSLLEVGTGFHPELTGRENIFLNGAILGMKKAEIRKNFDAIVAFAEIDEFVDVPVKRYSSGMYARLAFAVASHLDAEILLVDEVLAVGDVHFQRKCFKRISQVREKQGRTILLVSHNVASAEKLCDKVLWLQQGRVVEFGTDIRSIVRRYVGDEGSLTPASAWINDEQRFQHPCFTPSRLSLVDSQGRPLPMPVTNDREMWVQVEGEISRLDPALAIGFLLYSNDGQLLCWSFQTDKAMEHWPRLQTGYVTLRSRIPPRLLNEGTYKVELVVLLASREYLIPPEESAYVFLTIEGGLSDSPYWIGKRPGLIAPVLDWISV